MFPIVWSTTGERCDVELALKEALREGGTATVSSSPMPTNPVDSAVPPPPPLTGHRRAHPPPIRLQCPTQSW